MLVPIRWLREWIDLPSTVESLAEQLTMGGLEVDSIERTGPDLSALCVGHVLERNSHPNADRLSLCRVDVGGEEALPIVCGAPNVAAGQRVAVALPGTRLPDGTKLKKSKIRGETSYGMICSNHELGLGEDHDGILELDTNVPPGTPLNQVIEAGETVVEVAILANRGDCTSMLGIAREVRAHLGGELRIPEVAPVESDRPVGDDVRVVIDDPAGCYRYVARVVRGVRIGPSPAWLQEKLEAAGMRSINNVVDVTNLVMLEFGQPLHAFDLAKLRGGCVKVRAARDGEALTMIDEVERKLDAGDLVIADAERAIALAGVMGGAGTEVGEATTDLLIESAHFDPRRVRRSARGHGLSTDASYRFERSIDRDGVVRAADRAARLIAELAGGDVSRGAIEVVGARPDVPEEVELSAERLNRLLGTELDATEIERCLERVGVSLVREAGETMVFRVPPHRNDLAIAQDLIEEVARIHGFGRIPARTQEASLEEGAVPNSWRVTRNCCDALAADGLVEVQTFPFVDPSDLDALQLSAEDSRRQTVGIVNPIVEAESRLRSSLVPTLLHRTRENLNRQVSEVKLFEVARTFQALEASALPEERLRLTAIMTDSSEKSLWSGEDAVPLFFRCKGVAERLVATLGRALEFRSEGKEPYLHPGAAVGIWAGKKQVGIMGELHPACASAFEVEVPCAIIELDLSAIAEMPTRPLKYRDVSRFPLVRRDLAVLLDTDQQAGEVVDAIRQKAGGHLTDVEIFDRYEGKGVPAGRVSLAFRLTYQRSDRTLTDAEVTKATDRVIDMLARRFRGELR